VSEQVSVESFDALMCLRAALAKFADSTVSVLYASDAHLQRVRTWVKSDQPRHWQAEGRKRAELLIRAKLALKSKKLQPNPLNVRRACIEEEEAVKLATRRVEEAEQKAVVVRDWGRRIDEDALAYHAVSDRMKRVCTIDVPAALAKLDNMLAALEAYAAPAPTRQESTAASGWHAETETESDLQSVARPEPRASEGDDDARQVPDAPLERPKSHDTESGLP
jgi:hypothetical protein